MSKKVVQISETERVAQFCKDREYIDKYKGPSNEERLYEDRLYAYISRPADDDSPEAEEDYKRRMEQFKAFKSRLTPIRLRKKTRLTYDRLNDFMKTTGITLQKVFEVFELDEPEIISKEVADLGNLCDKMSQEKREYMVSVVDKLAADWRMSDLILKSQPTDRLFWVYTRMTPGAVGWTGNDNVPEIIREMEGILKSIPLASICEVCKYLKVPVHWAMRLSPESTVAGNDPQTQYIMDAYEFISDANKKLFFRLCEDAVEEDEI